MDAKQRQKLIDDLIDPKKKRFESTLSRKCREWFVDKFIDRFIAAGQSDAQIKTNLEDIVTKAKALAVAQRDFALALTAGDNGRFTTKTLGVMRRHRVEILYGLLAHEPTLAEATRLPYLLYLAKQRFRSVCRMYFWVNPNGQGYFRYPHKCKEPPPAPARYKNWRVNEDAEPFWQPKSSANEIPVQLEAPAGTTDPVTAFNKLFSKKSVVCRGNLLDCSTVATIIMMDALQEAADPDKLLKKLASKGTDYLLIHQLGFAGSTNFDQDSGDSGILKTLPSPAKDLQVGDHLYIYNHPLYKTFRPTGSWRGEHAFVYITGDHDYRSQQGFVFGGHGMNGTLYQFYDKFLSELKSHLALARQLMIGHLTFMRGGAAAIAPGTVIEEEHPIEVDQIAVATGRQEWAPAAPYRLLQYDMQVKARDFSKAPTKTKRKPKAVQPGFLIVQSKDQDVFYVDQIDKPDEDISFDKNLKKTISQIWPGGKTHYAIKFVRLTPAPGGATPAVRYAAPDWGVEYFDRSTSTRKTWAFFETVGTDIKRKELTLDDLFDSPFGLFTKAGTDLRVRQPKVDLGAGHQAFLTANGAF